MFACRCETMLYVLFIGHFFSLFFFMYDCNIYNVQYNFSVVTVAVLHY